MSLLRAPLLTSAMATCGIFLGAIIFVIGVVGAVAYTGAVFMPEAPPLSGRALPAGSDRSLVLQAVAFALAAVVGAWMFRRCWKRTK